MATARSAQQKAQQKKERFLEAYAELGTITHAATVAGIGRRTHYNWLEEDDDYAQAFGDAELAVGDMLEQEAIRRATQGVEKGVYHQGELVGTERTFSDTLMIFLLKGHKPEKYKERALVTSEVVRHDPSAIVDQARAKVLQFLPGGASQRTGS